MIRRALNISPHSPSPQKTNKQQQQQKNNNTRHPDLTSCSASGVLSPLGRCSSKPSTMQLAMMVSSTMYSNGVELVKDHHVRFGFKVIGESRFMHTHGTAQIGQNYLSSSSSSSSLSLSSNMFSFDFVLLNLSALSNSHWIICSTHKPMHNHSCSTALSPQSYLALSTPSPSSSLSSFSSSVQRCQSGDPQRCRSGLTVISKHSAGTHQGNELTRIFPGNVLSTVVSAG